MKLWETSTLCENCLKRINCNVIKEGHDIFLEKTCGACNSKEKYITHISSNSSYYLLSKRLQRDLPHYNRCNMSIIEVTNDCNMKCSTCISDSFPGAGNTKSYEEIKRLIDEAASFKSNPEILMISGGEPTIHPKFDEIIMYAYNSNFEHIMLITNGKILSEDPVFTKKLKPYSNKLEVYLQFDSCRNSVLKELRGEALLNTRTLSLKHLNADNISTTLVCVVKRGLNDGEIPLIIDYALKFQCVRGVTFQPIRETGRHNSFSKSDSITLSDVVDKVKDKSPYFNEVNLIPHPINPSHIAIGYLNKTTDGILNVTEDIFRNQTKLSNYMYFLPTLNNDHYSYDSLFRLTVVEYMDKFNFDFEDLEFSNIRFIESDGKLTSLEEHYLFS